MHFSRLPDSQGCTPTINSSSNTERCQCSYLLCLQDSAALADGELQQWGISLKGKDIYYGEFGLGGGTSQYCDSLATTPSEVRQGERGSLMTPCMQGMMKHSQAYCKSRHTALGVPVHTKQGARVWRLCVMLFLCRLVTLLSMASAGSSTTSSTPGRTRMSQSTWSSTTRLHCNGCKMVHQALGTTSKVGSQEQTVVPCVHQPNNCPQTQRLPDLSSVWRASLL